MTFQVANSDRSIRMRRIAGIGYAMKYSTIEDGNKVQCFKTRREAIKYAKKYNCRAYEWGDLIYGQLEINYERPRMTKPTGMTE